jgi:hypothetical protein
MKESLGTNGNQCLADLSKLTSWSTTATTTTTTTATIAAALDFSETWRQCHLALACLRDCLD